ncbi:MAG: M56 family metallopeptidase [Bacteroidota bacterium]
MNTFLINPLAEAFTWTLLHSIWQGFVLWILVVLVLKLSRMKSPSGKYVFGIMTLFTWVCWMGITFFQHIDISPTTYYEIGGLEFTYDAYEDSHAGFIHEEPSFFMGMQSFFHEWVFEYGAYFNLVWLAGFVVFGLKWVSGWMYIQYLRKSAYMLAEEHWRGKLELLLSKMDIGKEVSVMASDHVMSPILIGHLKPVILFPAALLVGMRTDQLEAVIAHELAHIKRHDYLVNLVLSGLEMILFYHPAYWWISNMIKNERELCCDDMAVQMIKSPLVYAEALAEIQSYEQSAVSLAMNIQGSNKQFLLGRVKRLLTPSLEKESSHRRPWLSFLLVIGIFLGIWGVTSSPLEAADDTYVDVVEVWEEGMMESFEEVLWEENLEEMEGNWEEEGAEEGLFPPEEFEITFLSGEENMEIHIPQEWMEARLGEAANLFSPEVFMVKLDTPILEKEEMPVYPESPEMPEMLENPEAPEFPEVPEMEEGFEFSIEEDIHVRMEEVQEQMEALHQQFESIHVELQSKSEEWENAFERELQNKVIILERKNETLQLLQNKLLNMRIQGETDKAYLEELELKVEEKSRELLKESKNYEQFLERGKRQNEKLVLRQETQLKDLESTMKEKQRQLRLLNETSLRAMEEKLERQERILEGKVKVMEERFNKLERELKEELLDMGLIRNMGEDASLRIRGEVVKLNGKRLNDQQARKLRLILKRYGIKLDHKKSAFTMGMD